MIKLYIKAIWEEDGAYFRSESNVPGLHIEADTLTAFEEVMHDVPPDLLAATPLLSKNINQFRSLLPVRSKKRFPSLWPRPWPIIFIGL